MKQRLSRIWYFIMVFALCYYALLYALFHYQYQGLPLIRHIQKKVPDAKGVFSRSWADYSALSSVDYLFLGSSHCYRGLDPDLFKEQGIKSFNLGSSSQTPLNSYSILEKTIGKTQNVILEVYPVTFSISANESFVDLFRCLPDYVFLLKQAVRIHEFLPFQFLLMKPVVDQVVAKKKFDPCVYHAGYVQVSDSAKNRNVVYETQKLDLEYMEIQFAWLNKIAALCKKHHKPLFLVFAPIPNQLHFNHEVEYRKRLYQWIQKYELAFFDYMHMKQLRDDHHFYDDDHLNAAGVRIFNEAFIQKIKQHEIQNAYK
jgi:hypothetical protein